MRSIFCFIFAASVICWLPSNAGVLNTVYDLLTSGYHGNRVATSVDFKVPIMLQLGVQSGRPHISGMNVKRKTFWKANIAGPLPVNIIRGQNDDGLLNDLGQSQKAMRYG